MGYASSFTVPCPQEILDKYHNGSELRRTTTVRPTTTTHVITTTTLRSRSTTSRSYATTYDYENDWWHKVEMFYIMVITNDNVRVFWHSGGALCLIFMLLLNRRKFIQSPALRLFTNYYLGAMLLRSMYQIYEHLFDHLIWVPIIEKYVVCHFYYPSYKFEYLENPAEYFLFKTKFQCYFAHINFIYGEALKHLLPLFLITHRLTSYFACRWPFYYQRYFQYNRLKYYYCGIGIAVYLIHYSVMLTTYHFQSTPYSYLGNYYSLFTSVITTLLVICHVVITLISLQVIVKYRRHAQNSSMQEFKSFLGFSIGPTIITIFQELVAYSNRYSWIYYYMDTYAHGSTLYSIYMLILDTLLPDIQPIYTCILYFIFVPFYRKLVTRLFCCYPKNCCNNSSIVHVMPSNVNVSRTFGN